MTRTTMNDYNAAVFTLTSNDAPDPFMIFANGHFYLTYTCGGSIEIMGATNLADFRGHGKATTIYKPPPNTPHSADIWAPELHPVSGRWYVYYAAAHPAKGNPSHRMYVLGGPHVNQDPRHGPWEHIGPMAGMPDHWAIDGTVFPMNNQLYFAWSGWPPGDFSDRTQQIFIARMTSPFSIDNQRPPTMIATPQHPWEFSDGDHGIQEGPQFLAHPSGAWQGIVYSCAGSWTNEYKMNALHYRGGDPLSPSAWQKDTRPLITTAPGGHGPWGPGHGSFLQVGDDTLAVYHATDGPADGWANRKARCQRVVWGMHGPQFGPDNCVGILTDNIETFTKGVPNDRPQGHGGGGGGFRSWAKGAVKDAMADIKRMQK